MSATMPVQPQPDERLEVLVAGSTTEAIVCYPGRPAPDPRDGPRLMVQESPSLVSLARSPLPAGYVCVRLGPTSHLAIVARALGLFCASARDTEREDGDLVLAGVRLRHGDRVTLTPAAILTRNGTIALTTAPEVGVSAELCRSVGVELYATVTSADELRSAAARGATGVGSVRMEHLLLGTAAQTTTADTLVALLGSGAEQDGLAPLREILTSRLVSVLGAAVHADIPVVVRLPDFDLVDLLEPADLHRLAERGVQVADLRGTVLAEVAPSVYETAVAALCEAVRRAGLPPERVTAVVPYVSDVQQVHRHADLVRRSAVAAGLPAAPSVGTMIETPAAAVLAAELAEVCSMFILGTNDLSALTLGRTRSHGGPAGSAGQLGLAEPVRRLLAEAVSAGRRVAPELVVGVCGESAVEPANLAAFAALGVQFVSPPARLVKSAAS